MPRATDQQQRLRDLLAEAAAGLDPATNVTLLREIRGVLGTPRAKPEYRCPRCRTTRRLQLCFPVWVPANDIDNRAEWELDYEAQPQKDGDKGWCQSCGDHVLVEKVPT